MLCVYAYNVMKEEQLKKLTLRPRLRDLLVPGSADQSEIDPMVK